MGQAFQVQRFHSPYERLVVDTRTLSRSQEPVPIYGIELSASECPNNCHFRSHRDTGNLGVSRLSVRTELGPASHEEPNRSSLQCRLDSPAHRVSLPPSSCNQKLETTAFEHVLLTVCCMISAAAFVCAFGLGLTAWFSNFDRAHALWTACVLVLNEFSEHITVESLVILALTALYLGRVRLWPQAASFVTSSIKHLSSRCSCPLSDKQLLTLMIVFMYVDQFLDGKIMSDMFQDSLHVVAFVFFLLVVFPQVLLWMFFYHLNLSNLKTLGCILCFPSLSMAGLTVNFVLPRLSPPWLGKVSMFVACLSLSPFLELYKCWIGKHIECAYWMTIAEGILEAAGSATLSLYLLLDLHKLQDVWLLVSIAWSILNTSRSAIHLHYYGDSRATCLDKAWRFIFVCFPRVASRIMTISLLAYLMRPAMHFFVLIVFCEIIGNCIVLRLVNSTTTMPCLALFSFIMVFVGSPGFLPSLEEAHIPQALLQTLLLVCNLGFATIISPLGSESRQALWKDYRFFTFAWLTVTFWSTAAVIAMATQKEARSLQERIKEANEKLYEAAKSKAIILCKLLLTVEGAEGERASDWIHKRGSRLHDTGHLFKGVTKWSDFAVHDGKLYASPNGVDSMLVVDPASQTEILSHILLPKQSCLHADKWRCICCYSDLLYCAPFSHEDVLIVDPVAKTTCTIPLGETGVHKWTDITACKGKLYCCPFTHSDVLVIDPLTKETTFIKTGISRSAKWRGIVAHGNMLYCAPCCHDDVLVIDTDAHTTSTIPTGIHMQFKWSGIASCNGKLYCAPRDHSDVLVIDPVTKQVSTIPTGCKDHNKWGSITSLGDKLYCAPWSRKEILVIDPMVNEVNFIDTGCSGDFKWDGIIALEEKLYCTPFSHDSVLADAGNIKDDRKLLVDLGL